MTGIGSREVYLYNRLFQEKLQLRQSSALPAHSKITVLPSVGRLKNDYVCRWELSWLLWDVVSPILQSCFKAKTSSFTMEVMLQMKWHKNALEKEKYLWARIQNTDVKCSNCVILCQVTWGDENPPGTVLVRKAGTDPVALDCDLVNGLKWGVCHGIMTCSSHLVI